MRAINIIKRAVEEFDFTFDMDDTMQDILDAAENCIREQNDYDRVDGCETNKHYDHLSWNDGKEFDIESTGEFISREESANTFFHLNDKGEFDEIEWTERKEGDYVLMSKEFDTDGQLVALVAKW